jgi:hypothetical protein
VSAPCTAACVVPGADEANLVEEISLRVIVELIAADKGTEVRKTISGVVGTGIVGCSASI